MSGGDATDRDAGFDDWFDAIDADGGYYLSCPDGHASLPPRRACPDCGATALSETPLPGTGTVVAHTVVRVAAPQFSEDTPYATAIVEFGPVRLTGQVRGVDPEGVENGLSVGVDVGETETRSERLLVFEPR